MVNFRESLQPFPISISRLNSPFEEYVRQTQVYTDYESRFGPSNKRSKRQYEIVEAMRRELRASGTDPFQMLSEVADTPIRKASVLSQHFFFLDPFLDTRFNAAEQLALVSTVTYITKNADTWNSYYSQDRTKRKKAYQKLNTVDLSLASSVIDIVGLTVEYMKKKAGSVDGYFQTFDGVDWGSIFDNGNINSIIRQNAPKYARRSMSELNIDSFNPHDLFALHSIKSGNPTDMGQSTSQVRMREFLRLLGLDTLAKKLVISPGVTSAANILFDPTHSVGQPVIYHSTTEGTMYNSLAHDKNMAHETGHVTVYEDSGCLKTPYLWASHGLTIEVFSMLFEQLYASPDVLAHFGVRYDQKTAQTPANLPLLDVLMLGEFAYRLYKMTEMFRPTPADLGRLQASLNTKYFGVEYDSSDPEDHTWQYTSADRLNEIFYDASYITGSALANALMKQLKDYFGSHWIGSTQFKQEFPRLLHGLFPYGAFTHLSDMEKMLDVKTGQIIEEQLTKELQT